MIINSHLQYIGRYCAERALDYEEFSRPGAYLFHANKVVGENSMVKYGRSHVFLAQLKDVCVFGDGFIVTNDGALFTHGLNHRNYHFDIDNYVENVAGSKFTLNLPDISAECAESAVLIWGWGNFAHWLFEYLPRIAVAAKNEKTRDIAYVITDDMPDRFVQFMIAAGISREQIIVAKQGDTVFFKELWVPSVVNYRGHYTDGAPYLWPEALHFLRQRILGARATLSLPEKNKAKRLYISRQSAEWRKPMNEDDVMTLLAQFGIESIDMHGMSYEKQMDYITNAEFIVIAGGGASPITMYAPTECVIVELTPTHIVGTWGSMAWAHVLGQYFHRVVCKSNDTSPDSNYFVNLQELGKLVAEIDRHLSEKPDFYHDMVDVLAAV